LVEMMPVGDPTDVVTGLEAPWSVAFVGDTALISERDSGRILEVLDDGSTREVGTIAGVEHGGEGGLLGIVARDGQLYAYSTGSDGNRIQRFPLTGSTGGLRLGEATTVLDGLPSAGIHNGGRLAFGPDDMLYATVGDASDADSAQDLEFLGGKILRMTPDGAVPADNPFPDSLVWTLGHRNVQGIAWTADGTMFASEFGQNTWDELNLIEAGGNYAWGANQTCAGMDPFNTNQDGPDPKILPERFFTPTVAPTGLAFCDGCALGERSRGTYFYGASKAETLRRVTLDDDRDDITSIKTVLTNTRVIGVETAPSGTMFFSTFAEGIFKLVRK
jgi:glucose/arabinose dehydrogenase